MPRNFEIAPENNMGIVIKVIGVGGGGGNAVNRMVLSGLSDIEFIAMNTDYQVLETSHAAYKLNIGTRLTKGWGAGGKADIGQRAAEESREEIAALIKGANMVFVTAGMGGGTGTGAAPVVAEIARSMDILTVAVVTKPFKFEGRRRMEHAEMGITSLREHVDALLVIPNDRLQNVVTEKITISNAFAAADEVLRQGVQSIADLVKGSGVINVDFADLTSVMKNAGSAHMGVGRASGKDKAKFAAEQAINSPLLETRIDGAMGVLVNITTSPDTPLEEVMETSELISNVAHPDVNFYWGVAYDENLNDEMVVTVIATGFEPRNDYGVSDYYNDIAAHKPKEGATAVEIQGSQTRTAPQAVAEPVVAPVVEEKPEEPPEEDPYEVIMNMFRGGRR